MKVKFKKLTENAVIPTYAKSGDAGLDLTATRISTKTSKSQDLNNVQSTDDLSLMIYHTDLAVEIPPYHVGLIFPRSSITKLPIHLANSVGVIDSGYRGELQIRMKFDAPSIGAMIINAINGDTTPLIPSIANALPKPGDRVAQLVILPYPTIEPEEVTELSDSERGDSGWGSSDGLQSAKMIMLDILKDVSDLPGIENETFELNLNS